MKLETTDERAEALRRADAFEDLPDDALHELAESAEPEQVRAGGTLLLQGFVGERMYVILEGSVNVERTGTDVATLGPGSFFGEIGVLQGRDRTASITAATDVRILSIPAETLARVGERQPDLMRRLETTMGERLASQRD